MLLYLDTSAFVPLIIDEPSSATCERAWTAASAVVSSALLVAECMAALSMAHRMGRLSTRQMNTALGHADELFGQVSLITATAALARSAGRLAVDHRLRGYDAVHLASALLLINHSEAAASMTRADDIAFASGDRDLLSAAGAAGLATIATPPR